VSYYQCPGYKKRVPRTIITFFVKKRILLYADFSAIDGKPVLAE